MRQNDLLNRLLQQNAAEILTWTWNVRGKRAPEPEEFNWLGLAEVASSNALQPGSRADAMDWASIAVSAYEELALRSTSRSDLLPYVNSALNLVTQVILRCGEVQHNETLNAAYVLMMVRRYLPVTYDEALQLIARREGVNIDEMRKLRQIKNLLTSMAPLGAAGYLSDAPDLRAWLLLLPQLP